jgi:hydrogenase-4 component F
MLVALLITPLFVAAAMAVLRRRRILEVIYLAGALASLGMGGVVSLRVWRMGSMTVSTPMALHALAGILRVDALSALMILVVTLLGAIAAIYSIGYLRAESNEGSDSRTKTFFALFHLFIFTMLLAVTTDNLGVMWVAIEGTTLATVFLVNLHNTRTSLEAAYKYLIVSSVGIALAFIGTVLMYYAGTSRTGAIGSNWTSLRAMASQLDPSLVRLAFAFILVGYGTKAGLSPMHTWLPDAHSEAPAPISALMSGVLLNVGLYALIRFKVVADLAIGPGFSSRCLLGLGLLSLAVAAVFLLSQRNYKRILAYSSVEHMGIICLGLGFGGTWGIVGALLHVLNHAFSKSMLFILSGNIYLKYQTTDTRRVRGLLRTLPVTGIAFLLGTLALVGLPPFGLFISEFLIFRAGVDAGMMPVVAIGISLVVVVFAGMMASVNSMLYGPIPESMERGDPLAWSLAPLAINGGLLLLLGLVLPVAVMRVLEQIIKVFGV